MANYKTLLFATDFSEGAEKAVDHARTLAKMTGARLHLLHVITELSDKRRKRVPADVIDTFIREVTRQAREDMDHFCQQHFSDAVEQGFEVTQKVEVGAGYEDILAEASRIQADLIIMGTHGRTGIEKVLVGSTAERVVRNSIIPVLTVRS
ncbi:MAG: universal stress protein [Nitrincola lacisaponensis]|uniref:universal stress protein n=1 Tax=Nitrincola lacisaponensis TaxID=267850 RepID=UPI00391CC33A